MSAPKVSAIPTAAMLEHVEKKLEEHQVFMRVLAESLLLTAPHMPPKVRKRAEDLHAEAMLYLAKESR